MNKYISIIAMVTLTSGLVSTASAENDSSFLSIGAGAMFGGEIAAGFTGDSGNNNLTKIGGAYTDVKANLGGDLCGPDCADNSVSANLSGYEHLGIEGEAFGDKTGDSVGSENLGIGQVGLGLNVGNTSFDIGGKTAFGGLTTGSFTGGSGNVLTEQKGGGGVDASLDYAGNGCTVNCGSGEFNLKGYAWEGVSSTVNASGNTSGDAVSAANAGLASTALQFTLQKSQID